MLVSQAPRLIGDMCPVLVVHFQVPVVVVIVIQCPYIGHNSRSTAKIVGAHLKQTRVPGWEMGSMMVLPNLSAVVKSTSGRLRMAVRILISMGSTHIAVRLVDAHLPSRTSYCRMPPLLIDHRRYELIAGFL